MKYLTFIIIFFGFTLLLRAADEKINIAKTIKNADKALKEGNLYVANDLYKKVMEADPNNVEVCSKLASTFLLARDYEAAERWYLSSYTLDSTNLINLYQLALVTKMQSKYIEAIPLFQKFIRKVKNEEAFLKYKKWARIESDGCQFSLKEKGNPFVEMKQLGREVNGNYTDVSPSLNNNYLYFSSIRSDTVIVLHPDSNPDIALFKMFKSPVGFSEQTYSYGLAQKFPLNDVSGMHVTNGAFSSDGQSYTYTVCNGGQTKTLCNVWVSKFNGNSWEPGEELDQNVNFNGYTTTHPFLAKLKNGTEVLFFSSDRPDGKGGQDIWYSVKDKKGKFGLPKNAGSKINSDRDEVTPYYDSETNNLYFSSNGLINMGGFDIYKSKGEIGKFENPENLGAPFNSSCEDLYFRPGINEKQGFIVSNRPGIFSIKGKTCCHDIFSFNYKKVIALAVTGNVYLDGDPSKTPIKNVPFFLSLQSNPGEGIDVVINSDTTKGDDYFFRLNPEKAYKLSCVKEGYFTTSSSFNTLGIQNSDTLRVDLYLKKFEKNKEYRLNNIYYDFDKWDLREESKFNLDTLYNILIENPTIIIELGSHTDSRGSDSYNQTLSQKRAESCVNYLISKGISKERITAKGYGESQTLNDCSKIDGCVMDQSSDCDCHQLNRRTVFKIVGELDGKLIQE